MEYIPSAAEARVQKLSWRPRLGEPIEKPAEISAVEQRLVGRLGKIPELLLHPGAALLVGFLIVVTGRGALLLHTIGFLAVALWLSMDVWVKVLGRRWPWRFIVGCASTSVLLIIAMVISWWELGGKLQDQQDDVYQHLTASAYEGTSNPMEAMFTFSNGGKADIAKHQMFCIPVGITTDDFVIVDGRGGPRIQYMRPADIPIKGGGDGESGPCPNIVRFEEGGKVICADVIVGLDYELETQPGIAEQKRLRFVFDTKHDNQWHQQGVDYKDSYCPLGPSRRP